MIAADDRTVEVNNRLTHGIEIQSSPATSAGVIKGNRAVLDKQCAGFGSRVRFQADSTSGRIFISEVGAIAGYGADTDRGRGV